MSNSIVDIGELSKPATVLVERISDAVGGFFKPYQIERVARAEAKAAKIRAKADIEISELQERAINRFVAEEAQKQKNIEDIGTKALTEVREDADPEAVEDDWIINFFDKCRLISDEEMQDLWARVLSGEANQPGSYSKRIVNFLSSMGKRDAQQFTNLCRFAIDMGPPVPLIYELSDPIYRQADIDLESVAHLDDIGLLRYESLSGFSFQGFPEHINVKYFDTTMEFRFPSEAGNSLPIGKVKLSRTGKELAKVCKPSPVEGFTEYLSEQLSRKNIAVSVPISFVTSRA